MSAPELPFGRLALRRLADFLVEETMSASDEETRDEARALYGDERKLANEEREIFARAWRQVFPDRPLPTANSQNISNKRL